jgi:hypothetical protein
MHPQKQSNSGYLSYMLRMWRKRDGNGKAVWCASLEEPGSRHTEIFEDTNAMFAFLQSQLGTEHDKPGEHAQGEQEAQWEQQG